MNEGKITQSKQIEKSAEGQTWWRQYMDPLPSESPESYMHRVLGDVRSDGILDFIDDENIQERRRKELDWPMIKEEMFARAILLLDKPRERMSVKELRRQLFLMKDGVYTITNRIQGPKNKIDYFAKTNRDRLLYTAEPNGSIMINDLFGIPRGYEFEDIKPLFEKRINGKNIYLLGGGNSVMDFLTEKKFTPKQVINIDPYLTEESIDKNVRNIYQSIPLPAESDLLIPELKNRSLPKADEIWATYSVPCYLETGEAIRSLFKNIDALLAENGIARIGSIDLANFSWESEEVFSADSWSVREKALIDSMQGLVQTGNYNLDIIDGTLHLQKII